MRTKKNYVVTCVFNDGGKSLQEAVEEYVICALKYQFMGVHNL